MIETNMSFLLNNDDVVLNNDDVVLNDDGSCIKQVPFIEELFTQIAFKLPGRF